MTREEIDIFEKLIMANNLYTENLVKNNEIIKQILSNQEIIANNLKQLNSFLKEMGDNNLPGIIKSTVSNAVKESNKPLYNFIKLLAVISTFFGGLLAILKLFIF